MVKYITIFVILLSIGSFVSAQGFAFGPKGGLAIGQQNLSGYQRDALFAFSAAMYIESLSEENKNALFAQLGYHVRGSAIRIQRYVINGQTIQGHSQKSKFGNLGLQFGAKQKFDLNYQSKWFFGFALRGEYNLTAEFPTVYENWEDRINKFVYGFSAGIGAEFMFSELVGTVIEFSIHPDLSDQLVIPGQQAVNSSTIIPEKRVRNISYELTLGFRFLRKVIYE